MAPIAKSICSQLACLLSGVTFLPGTAVTLAAEATTQTKTPAAVDASRLAAADSEPQNWFTGGRDQYGTYYSPLDTINDTNAKDLGFAWQYDLAVPIQRGQEATPIVVDGIMYTSSSVGYVYAVDAATGREKWRYDPKSDFFASRMPCCDLVNRGVAVWKGKVYVVSVDGRMHAIDAATGKKVWEADTIPDHKQPYSSTGAPQIAGNVVVIGSSGADMSVGGVRGNVSAYDLETGAFKWRFYTVPDVANPQETPAMAAASKTWDPGRDPKFKGGASTWDGIAYDPELKLVYVGTANPAPYDLRQLGSQQGDSLYSSSIVAIHAETGQLAWHYQTTPRDSWDFDATQKMILTDLEINGKKSQVLLQANKNGFFYVLDRKSGKLLSAKNFAYVNWATAVDMKTGRPIITPNSDWYKAPKVIYPSWSGAHTWMPMSLSAKTHLVYIPTMDVPAVWVDMPGNGGESKFIDGEFSVGTPLADDSYDADGIKDIMGVLPSLKEIKSERKGSHARELIVAWDPVAQKKVWEHETSSGMRGYNGGIISTAGNLVFQGRGDGGLWVYAADTGKVLKIVQTGSHIMAAPTTYSVDGQQYVAVQVGYGGTGISVGSIPPNSAAYRYENTNRIVAFKLGGGKVPTPAVRIVEPFEKPPEQTASKETIHAGELKFVEECSRCHVLDLNITPDLRRLNAGLHASFKDIVLKGLLAPAGMERFDDLLTEKDVDNIHAYLIEQAWVAYREQEAKAHPHP